MASSPVNGGDSPSSDLTRKLEAFIAKAEDLMSKNQFSSAIARLTEGLKLSALPSDKALLLASRSRAYTRMAHWLLHGIPAEESESRAIMAQDPQSLAELGLQDAKKLSAIAPTDPEAYLQQGVAYMLLDNHMEAKAQLLEGLGVDPFHEELQKTLRAVQHHLAGEGTGTGRSQRHFSLLYLCQATRELQSVTSDDESSRSASPAPALASTTHNKRKVRSVEDAECSLCMKLFFEPVTTPCGHSFCRHCFLRARDHNNKCPMCRTLLPVGKEIPVTAALCQILQSSFPEEYEARRQEERAQFSGQEGEGEEQPLPLFVMTSIFPGEEISLNIFEPRYRLLVRRSMEGSRKLGMGAVDSSRQLCDVATELEICECQALPDGRFHIEVKAKRRFRILRSWEQDGVRIAQPEFFHDTPPEAASPEAEALQSFAKSAIASILAVRDPLERYVLGMGGTPPNMLTWIQGVSEAPTAEEAEKLSFWLACLLQPFHRFDRLQLLRMTSTMERLTFLVEKLNQVVSRLDRTGTGRWECVIS